MTRPSSEPCERINRIIASHELSPLLFWEAHRIANSEVPELELEALEEMYREDLHWAVGCGWLKGLASVTMAKHWLGY